MKKFVLSILLISIAAPAQSAGLSARVSACEPIVKGTDAPAAIAASILASVTNTLVGSSVSAIVNYLNAKRATTYTAVTAVEDASELTNALDGNCLYISSTRLDGIDLNQVAAIRAKSKFFASISLQPSKLAGDTIFRPEIRSWSYVNFLESGCPLFRNCARRDVVMKLTLEAPALPATNTEILAEPIGISLVNVHKSKLNDVLQPGAKLPWIKANALKGPVNVRFTLTETSSPNQFTNALAVAIDAQKANIQSSVNSRTRGVPDSLANQQKREQLNMASVALEQYKAEYIDALSTYRLYQDSATDSPSRQFYLASYQTKKQAARIRSVEVLSLYAQAGLTIPALPSLP